MATKPVEREPIRNCRRGYGSDRIHLSASQSTPIHFFDASDLEAPVDEVIVAGCSEIFVQGRLCGDFYVEIAGPKFCVSAVANLPADAARAALAKASAR